jgi:alkylresorcinol/alkylpyrone synthase
MPRVESVGTALPPHVLHQSDVKSFAHAMFGSTFGDDIHRLLGVFDNADIATRHFCVPLEWFASPASFEEKNALYIENALALSAQAIERCLDAAQLRPEDIDCIITVSTTGLSTPSLDARLMNKLPFRWNVRRLPVWGLGCAGGAASLSWARTIAETSPDIRILIVVVELCGLTFMHNDFSKAALIATSLFSDGAAAVLVTGDNVPARHAESRPHLLASSTATLPGSLDVMGWEFCNEGFKIVISRDIPSIIGSFVEPAARDFLSRHDMSFRDISQYILHPGGTRVLQAYKESFGLDDTQLRHVYGVLHECGNMSAVTVLFVLQRFMESLPHADGDYGLLAALGPGFSCEQLLVRWEPVR